MPPKINTLRSLRSRGGGEDNNNGTIVQITDDHIRSLTLQEGLNLMGGPESITDIITAVSSADDESIKSLSPQVRDIFLKLRNLINQFRDTKVIIEKKRIMYKIFKFTMEMLNTQVEHLGSQVASMQDHIKQLQEIIKRKGDDDEQRQRSLQLANENQKRAMEENLKEKQGGKLLSGFFSQRVYHQAPG